MIMGKYLFPKVSISDDWQDHKNRNSAEPGTDFALTYGSKVYAPYNGRVRVANSSPSGAPGRYVGIDLSDGNYFRALHLSSVSVKAGQNVKKGQLIGYSGGSGFGNNHHYGSHVHFSLWVGTDPIKSSWKGTTDIVKYSNDWKPAVKHVTRVAVKGGVHGRSSATTKSRINQLLEGPGEFDKWTHGESVEGNNIWFQGYYSNDWFWSGGFTSKSTSGMTRV